MTIKSDGITADAKGRHSNIETVLSQVRMALRKKTWDAPTQTAVAVNHGLLVATGTITESGRTYLLEQLCGRAGASRFRDARILSEVSCRIDLPSVHVPTELGRQRRSRCGMREELTRLQRHYFDVGDFCSEEDARRAEQGGWPSP